MVNMKKFDELSFFATVKKKPGMFFGKPSLLSLRDHLFGMSYAFRFCDYDDALRYSHLFIKWYNETKINDRNGYACWWNHILYISGNDDKVAFFNFFEEFEMYLAEVHGLELPEA